MSGPTIKAFVSPFFLLLLICLSILMSSCKCSDLRMSYNVVAIYHQDKDISELFRGNFSIGFYDDNKIGLPFYSNNPRPYPVEYSTYYYNRKECKIYINDHIQNFFTGEYDVKFVVHNPPRVWLESDKLRIILEERRFSVERPFIPIEWGDRPKRDSL